MKEIKKKMKVGNFKVINFLYAFGNFVFSLVIPCYRRIRLIYLSRQLTSDTVTIRKLTKFWATLSECLCFRYRFFNELTLSCALVRLKRPKTIFQDFEALTPNLLARTIETIEGGGVIVFLLKTVSSLKQLYTMTMVGYQLYRKPALITLQFLKFKF